MTRLSVNVNKFALLRNSRGGDLPSVLNTARRCLDGGARGITVHPRMDQRHILYRDVYELSTLLQEYPQAEFNVEGTPNEKLLEVVLEVRPAQCTLVPDAPGQLTSDHGWKLDADEAALVRPAILRLKDAGIRVSLFIDDDARVIERVRAVGADAVELYTGPYAFAFAQGEGHRRLLDSYREVAEEALRAGLVVNAGHDLNLINLAPFLQTVPEVAEVSIGHAFICECIESGFDATLEAYLALVSS